MIPLGVLCAGETGPGNPLSWRERSSIMLQVAEGNILGIGFEFLKPHSTDHMSRHVQVSLDLKIILMWISIWVQG